MLNALLCGSHTESFLMILLRFSILEELVKRNQNHFVQNIYTLFNQFSPNITSDFKLKNPLLQIFQIPFPLL